jgi:hypothetical protein
METFEIFWNKEIGPVFSYGRKRVGDEDEAKSACSPRIRPALSFSSPIKDDHQQKKVPKKIIHCSAFRRVVEGRQDTGTSLPDRD